MRWVDCLAHKFNGVKAVDTGKKKYFKSQIEERRKKKSIYLFLLLSVFHFSCAKKKSVSEEASTSNSGYLYVSTGMCYSGNNTTFNATTSSNLVFRLNGDTGQRDLIIADYGQPPSQLGDTPVDLYPGEDNNLWVLVENATAAIRRVDLVTKSNYGSRVSPLFNATAFASALRSLLVLPGGDFLIARTAAIELVTAGSVRIGAPYINPTAAPCNTSNTGLTRVLRLPGGKYLFAHGAAAQNRIGIMGVAGGTTCLAGQAAPIAGAYPTALVYDEENSYAIVGYAGNVTTNNINSIYAYSIDETLNTISNAQEIYDRFEYPATYNYHLYGISAMALDPVNQYLYVASAISDAATTVNYKIEKFSYHPELIGVENESVLQRVTSVPFYNYGSDTKCVSDLIWSED